MNSLRDPSSVKDGLLPTATVGAAAVSAPSAAGPSAAELAEILEKLPADDYQTAGRLCEELLAGGPAVIEQLVRLVGDQFGDPNGVKPKYALHGLASYASRPGADGQRKMLAGALAKEVSGDHSDELKAFIVRQLQLCGRPQEVPALAKLLASDRLCNPATQALVAVGGRQALTALRNALPAAGGSREVAIRQAVQILSRK